MCRLAEIVGTPQSRVKYSLQRIKKSFILHCIDMKVTPMDSLRFTDENHTKCHVNRTIFNEVSLRDYGNQFFM